jgi:hypothetical protein
MTHYAKVEDTLVIEVIVAEAEFVDSSPGEWIQTSYNTHGGVHSEGGIPLRKNFAGIGMTYDSTRDAFYGPQPYNSWILNEDTCSWEAPVEQPAGNLMYSWDEEILNWVLLETSNTKGIT